MTAEVRRVCDLDELRTIYDLILEPSFPVTELCTRDELLAASGSGDHQVWQWSLDGRPAGVAIVGMFGRRDVALLLWLAVHPERRASGVGAQLLTHVLAALDADGVRVLLGEMENPSGPVHPTHGDPARRAAFYRRRGAKVLAIPHEAPPAREGLPSVEMLLFALPLPSHPLGDGVEAEGVLHLLRAYRGLTEDEYVGLCRYVVGGRILCVEV